MQTFRTGRLIRNLSLDGRLCFRDDKCVDNVAVQGRWPLTTGSPKAGTTVIGILLDIWP